MKRNQVAEAIYFHFKNKWLTELIKASIFFFLFIGKTRGQPYETIPFNLIGQTIIINATIDGEQGNFIFDTGSPGMVLNSRYFIGYEMSYFKNKMVDINGEKNKSFFYQIKRAAIASFQLPNELAWVIDLSGIEEMKGIPIMGIIGFRSFKKSEFILDLEGRQLFICQPKEMIENMAEKVGYIKTDSLPFQLIGHIPYINGHLKNKPIRLGIDTGSEVNILHFKNLKGQTELFKPEGQILIQGVGEAPEKKAYGAVNSIMINGKPQILKAALIDLRLFNKTRVVPLDGILGIPFFDDSVVAINYRKKILYFLERPAIMVGIKEKTITDTGAASPLQNK